MYLGKSDFRQANTCMYLGKSVFRRANTYMYLGKSVFWWQIHICIWANRIFGGKYQLVFGQIGLLVVNRIKREIGLKPNLIDIRTKPCLFCTELYINRFFYITY